MLAECWDKFAKIDRAKLYKMWNMKTFLLLIIIMACSVIGDYYIRSDALGDGSGSDWTNAFTSTDSIFLGDTFINTVGNLRIHDGLINVPIPEDMPSNWYKVSINDIEFVDDSIRVFVPKWGN